MFRYPNQINERAARMVAGVIALALVTLFVLDLPEGLPLLAIGFWLRAGFGPQSSLLATLAAKVSARLWDPVMAPGSPKRFAQLLGAVATTVASVLFALGHEEAGWAVTLLVAILASFEATLAACLGCWIYGYCVLPRKPELARARATSEAR